MMRVLQGVGGAMMVPVGRLVVMRNTGKADVIRAIAYLTWPSLLAPVLSPVIGGLLTQYASWHWIFLINLPLGICATIAAVRLIERTERGHPPPLDWPGFISSGICLACIVVVAALVGGAHVPVIETVSLSILGVASGLWAYRHLRTTANPLVRFDALRVRTFRFSQTAGTLFKTGINAVPFVLPLFFQDGFGWTPSRSGATVMFLFVGNLAIKPVTTPLLRAVRFRTVLIVTSLGGAITVAACALLRVDTPFTVIVALLVISGVFRSTGYTCFNTIAFADIDQSIMSQANTLSTTTQQLTNGFAVAVAVLSLKAGTDMFGHASGYPFALVVLAVIVVISMVMSMRLPASAGDTIRKVEEVDE
jgi:Major Facilitator Superfamily